jgi:hypothetical protein
MIQLFAANAEADTANLNMRIGLSLTYMLVIPTFLPSTLSAYSVVGEREQGTLEPVLITPVRHEEFQPRGKTVPVVAGNGTRPGLRGARWHRRCPLPTRLATCAVAARRAQARNREWRSGGRD